jgi:hypothetical protein
VAVACATGAAAAEPGVEPARRLYAEGMRHKRRGDLDAACAAFARALASSRQPQIAGELGACALREGRIREAVGHLRFALEEPEASMPAARREALQTQLDAALAQVGRVLVETDVAGAVVVIGEETMGPTPLDGPVVVDPGRVRVEARLDRGPRAAHELSVAAGELVTVRLVLGLASSPPLGRASPRPRPPVARAGAPATRSTAPLWIGVGAAAALAAGGAALTAFADARTEDARVLVGRAASLARSAQPCPGSRGTEIAATCAAAVDALEDHDTAADGAAWMFGLGAAALAGGVAGYLLQPADREAVVAVGPLAAASGGAGVVLHGRF